MLVAGSCVDEREAVYKLVAASKISEQPANDRIRLRSVIVQMWKLCRDSSAEVTEEAVTIDGETGLK